MILSPMAKRAAAQRRAVLGERARGEVPAEADLGFGRIAVSKTKGAEFVNRSGMKWMGGGIC